MNKWQIAFAVSILTTGLTVSVTVRSQQPSASTSKSTRTAGSSQVHNIVLPQYPSEVAQGPNVEIYSKNCLICHTARYVSMQPRFSKTVWQNEVKKMVDTYGASISETDQTLIVEYLVAVNGEEGLATGVAPPK
jgi:cytochrome c5